MNSIIEIVNKECDKILNNQCKFNTVELYDFKFTFNVLCEGILLCFEDTSLKDKELTLWKDFQYNKPIEYKDVNQFPVFNNSSSFINLCFFNKPVRIFTEYKKYQSTKPARSIASKVEHTGTWYAPYVSEWTHFNESKTEEIDESQLAIDFKRNKLIFLKEVQKRIYLNQLFKEYKKSRGINVEY